MSESAPLVVGMTGATGIIYGIRLLEMLRRASVETHLILSRWARRTMAHETEFEPDDVLKLATRSYPPMDLGAAVSSGSFATRGMVIVPCSVRTLGAIAAGQGDNLIHRAADVTLKERRKLVLVLRETPLSDIHLENMLKLSRMGAVMCPPVPAFYQRPRGIDDIIDYTVVRVLDQVGIHLDTQDRWEGEMRGERAVGI